MVSMLNISDTHIRTTMWKKKKNAEHLAPLKKLCEVKVGVIQNADKTKMERRGMLDV